MTTTEPIESNTELKVAIRRQWNDWKIAYVPLSEISELHWSTVSGGVGTPSPQPFIYGYVFCDDVDGDISHSCKHGPGPHRIKVCIVKKDNDPKVFDKLLVMAGPKPRRGGTSTRKKS